MIINYPGIVGTIDIYMMVLRAICGDTNGKSMIDLCCCTAPNTPRLGFGKRRYFDIIDRKLDHPEEQQYFEQADVLSINWFSLRAYFSDLKKCDVAICSDGIEHMTIADGHKLLGVMDAIAHKQVLFTPTTDLFGMAQPEDKDPEAHRSLWTPDMLPGYASIVFPNYHQVWSGGAFFAWKCDGIESDFERVKNQIQL